MSRRELKGAAGIGHNSRRASPAWATPSSLTLDEAAVANTGPGRFRHQLEALVDAVFDVRLGESPLPLLLLAALIEHSNRESGVAYPGNDRLQQEIMARLAQVPAKERILAIDNAVARIRECGRIVTERRAPPQGGPAVRHVAITRPQITPEQRRAAVAAFLDDRARETARRDAWKTARRQADLTGHVRSGGADLTCTGRSDLTCTGEDVGPLSITEPTRVLTKKERGADAPLALSDQDLDSDPTDLAVAAYNTGAVAHGWQRSHAVIKVRRRQLADRLAEIGGIEAWRLALTAIPDDDWLMGRVEAAPGLRRFRLDLDHLLKPGVLERLLDAAMDAAAKPNAAAAPVSVAHLDEHTRALHARLRARYGEEVYASWFQHLVVEAIEEGTVRTSLPTKFLQTWVRDHYADPLLECCRAQFAGAERVSLIVRAAP